MMKQYCFSPLVFEPVGDGIHYVLVKPLFSTAPDGTQTIVPSGFTTDLASVPDLARIGLLVNLIGLILVKLLSVWFYPVAIIGGLIIFYSHWIGCNSLTDEPATLHDWRYWQQDKSFFFANWELLHTLQVRNAKILAWIYFINVTLFGYASWLSDAKRKRLQKSQIIASGKIS